MKSILHVRRGGSKKGHKGLAKDSPRSNKHVETKEDRKLSSERGRIVSSVDQLINGQFEERNIDEAIETRTRNGNNDDQAFAAAAWEEMRRRREENIYSARRVFIAGPGAADSDSLANAVEDRLVRHTRHLNLSGSAMDVLSPETREKVRRLQMEGQLAAPRPPPQPHRSHPADDASSVTSDYSTTSSAAADPPPRIRQGQTGQQGFSVSSNGTGCLPLSDYSSGGSPITPRLCAAAPPSPSPPHGDNGSEAIGHDSSDGGSGSASAALTASLYDRTRLRRVPRGRAATATIPIPQSQSPAPSDTSSGKAWYEELDETSVRSSDEFGRVDATTEQAVLLDQNRNVAAKSPSRALSTEEHPVARISQKIRFRKATGIGEKRKDPRRHTLSDLEHVKSALFGNGAGAGAVETKTSLSGADGDRANGLNGSALSQQLAGRKPAWAKASKSKTGKLKAWFKESFRKSSPELYEPEPVPVAPEAAVV